MSPERRKQEERNYKMKTDLGYTYCAICQRKFRAVIPKGGDGSIVYPYKHKIRVVVIDKHETKTEVCPGSYRIGKDTQPYWNNPDETMW